MSPGSDPASLRPCVVLSETCRVTLGKSWRVLPHGFKKKIEVAHDCSWSLIAWKLGNSMVYDLCALTTKWKIECVDRAS